MTDRLAGSAQALAASLPVTWVLDLDGVIWVGEEAVPGSPEAVARLREAGQQVLFATNDSSLPAAVKEDKLARFGIPAEGCVVTSGMAAALLVEPGDRVLACGGPGVAEAVRQRGAEVVDASEAAAAGANGAGRFDVVVAGFHWDFDYERLRVSAQAVMAGARFLATNEDATFPSDLGIVPAGGAIVAAIAFAAGTRPEVAGKPHAPMVELIHGRSDGEPGTMVGDRPDSDGVFARALGYRFGLVLTGVTDADDLPVEPTPDMIAPNLYDLVQAELEM